MTRRILFSSVSLAALTTLSLLGCGGGGTPSTNPTPTPSPGLPLTRAEVVGTWKIVAVRAPLLTSGLPTSYNTDATDQPCPATITNKDASVPSVGCGGASTLTFQDDGVVVNNTGQKWLTTIMNSGATDTTVGISKWTIATGALPGVVRIATLNQSVIGEVNFDARRETPVGGKLRMRAALGTSGVGAFSQFFGVELVMEKS